MFALLLSPLLAVEPVSSNIPVAKHEMVVSTQWLAQHLHEPGLIILQVSMPNNNFVKGHIPGARFLSWSEVAVERQGIANELPPLADLVKTVRELGITDKSKIVLYDEGAGLQAARAYVALDYLGLGSQTALLDGHLKVWQSEKRPMSQEINKYAHSTFEPRLNPDVLTFMSTVQDIVWLNQNHARPPIRLLDARPEAQFIGTDPGEGITRGGHIPGASSLFWMQHVQSEDKPLLKSPDALHRLFKQAGIGSGATVVTYCRTGGQASHTYFVSKYLGFKTRLYDGSFSEWSKNPSNPVTSGAESPKLP